MANNHVGEVSFFEIGGAESSAIYAYRAEVPVNGQDPKDVIRDIANVGNRPGGGDVPARVPGDPDRYLDIRETRSGLCTYAFLLNAQRNGRHRLKFVPGRPIIPLPFNSDSGEQFLTDFDMEYGGEGLWASFSCDTDAVRESDLVRRLGGGHSPEEQEHHHPIVLTIPFTLNVVDPIFGVSPWIVQRDPLALAHVLTHGGVHPSSVSFLTLEV